MLLNILVWLLQCLWLSSSQPEVGNRFFNNSGAPAIDIGYFVVGLPLPLLNKNSRELSLPLFTTAPFAAL